jgi:hypothetical protein
MGRTYGEYYGGVVKRRGGFKGTCRKERDETLIKESLGVAAPVHFGYGVSHLARPPTTFHYSQYKKHVIGVRLSYCYTRRTPHDGYVRSLYTSRSCPAALRNEA